MSRKARRLSAAPRLESLETRALLSADPGRSVVAAWVPTTPTNAAATLLVRFESSATSAAIAADLAPSGGRVVSTFPDGPSVVALPPWVSSAAALAELKVAPGVLYAEADTSFKAAGVSAAGTPVVPGNNPGFGQQWGMAADRRPVRLGPDDGEHLEDDRRGARHRAST